MEQNGVRTSSGASDEEQGGRVERPALEFWVHGSWTTGWPRAVGQPVSTGA